MSKHYIDYKNKLRQCPGCGHVKSFLNFYKNNNKLKTPKSYCKECSSKRRSVYHETELLKGLLTEIFDASKDVLHVFGKQRKEFKEFIK